MFDYTLTDGNKESNLRYKDRIQEAETRRMLKAGAKSHKTRNGPFLNRIADVLTLFGATLKQRHAHTTAS
jgi:hypothetical protein